MKQKKPVNRKRRHILAKKIFTGNKKNTPRRETFYLARYMVIRNDCSRSRPCPCYEIFAAFM
jgi:hypothetical protein